MQKALAEAETGEAGLPRRDQQSGEIMAAKGDVEGEPLVARQRGAADPRIVQRAAMARGDRQPDGEPALQRLQVIERRRIDKNLAATAAGDVSRGEIRPALARPRAQR
jgi:hypothetical protein